MTLQETIQNDLRQSLKNRNSENANCLKILISEFQRGEKKILSDDEVLRILKKLEKSELELLTITKNETSIFLEALQKYLPKMITDEEIKAWVSSNVDFSKLKNKMQAVGAVTKHFGQAVDGNVVKKIIQEM